jgi:hypothetical protein
MSSGPGAGRQSATQADLAIRVSLLMVASIPTVLGVSAIGGSPDYLLYREELTVRSARSWGVADLQIGRCARLSDHGGTENE